MEHLEGTMLRREIRGGAGVVRGTGRQSSVRVARGLFALLCLALGVALSARAVPADAPFFFVQLTDPQMAMYTANADVVQETANLEFAVATINRLRPAFVVVTGDLVNRAADEAQVAAYQRVMGGIDKAIAVYNAPGNHDVENEPTPVSLAAYTKRFGPDHFSFRHGGFAGIVVSSVVLQAPQKVPAEAAEQDRWLRAELARVTRDGARRIVVFQHHPIFVKDAAEEDGYDNIPRARRAAFLALLHQAGVRHVFAGHYHRNALARDGDLEMVTTGPIGTPLNGGKSGLRIVTVTDAGIEHRYYELSELPNRIALSR
jgi:3',5'-cyclic AMP phosphodiesterase CpdA